MLQTACLLHTCGVHVRGGRHLDKELVRLIKMAPDTAHMNFDMLDNHVWWPIIEADGLNMGVSVCGSRVYFSSSRGGESEDVFYLELDEDSERSRSISSLERRVR